VAESDVLIAGGGPAGTVTAAMVAAAGFRTLLVERQEKIGWPVHTSGATAPATLERYSIPAELHHPIHRVRLRGPTAQAIFDYESPVASIIDVTGTYDLLARRAAEAGAALAASTRATKALMKGSRVIGCVIERADGTREDIAARVVVDATGYRAAISKSADLHPGFRRFGVGGEYELIAPNCDQREALLIVGSRYAPTGYAWVFPRGQGRVRVGVGIHHGDVRSRPRDHLELLVEEAHELGVDLTQSSIEEYHFGLIPADGLPSRLAGDGILAVGDAACQATLVAGEGIRISMDAATLAGEAIVASLRAGDREGAALADYQRGFRRRFGRALAMGYAMNRRLARFDDREWDEKVELLGALPARAIPVLLQAEFSLRELLPLILSQPRLLRPVAQYGARGVRARVSGARAT